MENSKQTKPHQFINVNRVNEMSDKLYKYVIEKTDILEKKMGLEHTTVKRDGKLYSRTSRRMW